MTSVDWQTSLHMYLIKGGTQGRKRSEITRAFQGIVTADVIENELLALQAMGKADKFLIPPASNRAGRKTIVWRATTKILEK